MRSDGFGKKTMEGERVNWSFVISPGNSLAKRLFPEYARMLGKMERGSGAFKKYGGYLELILV